MPRCKTHLFLLAISALLIAQASVASAAPDTLKDPDVLLAVETELMLDDAVPEHNIDVSLEDGIVTLTGTIDSFVARLKAEESAESVKGVLAVVNNIDVQPVARTDAQLRSDILASLALDPVTESFQIHVSVDDGIVTLSGDVDSYTEKLAAEEVVQDLKGVAGLENQLTYDVAADRSDTEIRTDIEYRLRSDASIDATSISVDVDDAQVTLAGTAGSATEKSEAETEAWIVPGVRSVANRIDVQWQAARGTGQERDGWSEDDIAQAIENALQTNPRVKSFQVTATVHDGVARLTGVVDNLQARRAAADEAEDTAGVRRVKNFLRVRLKSERPDYEIARDIRDALRRDPHVDRFDIAVIVNDGVARLSGEVDSWYMEQRAEDAAAGVLGVVGIDNKLDVDSPYTEKMDREIKDDIEDQLFWSPFVDQDEITVAVRAGVATLTGTVEDWDEFQAARENALEGGAVTVVSNLDIESGSQNE